MNSFRLETGLVEVFVQGTEQLMLTCCKYSQKTSPCWVSTNRERYAVARSRLTRSDEHGIPHHEECPRQVDESPVPVGPLEGDTGRVRRTEVRVVFLLPVTNLAAP